MRIRFRYLASASVAAAIIGAPTAVADDTNPTCTSLGGSTECSTPGNVEINSSPSVDTFTLPYWDEAFGGAYGGPYPVPYDEGNM